MTNLEYILALIKSDLTKFDNLNNLFDMLRIYEKENCKEAHKFNKYVKKYSALGSKSGGKDFEKFYTLNKQAYLFDAKVDFESFLIYIEWDRDPEKRFYLPRKSAVFDPLVKGLQALEDDEIDILTLSLPPGIGKTTLGCFFLSWVMGKYPDSCNLASAYGDKLTRGFYDQVQTIITDPEYLYHDVFPDVTVQGFNAKEETINLNHAKRFKTLTCRSIDGALTGATRCEKYLYCDDLVSGIEEAMNIERLNTLWNKFANDLRSRKKKFCKEIHIATRWSIHDVIGRIQSLNANNPRARFISVPALNEKGESNFDYKYGVGFDTQAYEKQRETMDDVSWRCLYLNEPVEREGLLFPADTLKYFNGVLPMNEPDRVIAFCDVAWGGGDFLSMPIGVLCGEDLFITDVVFNNADKTVTKPEVAGKLIKNKVQWLRVEANNGGDEYAEDVESLVRGQSYHMQIDWRKTSNKSSKLARIVQYSPDIAKCYFLQPSLRDSEYREFMNNITGFMTTKENAHDDAPDSMVGLVNMAFKNYGVQIMQRPF